MSKVNHPAHYGGDTTYEVIKVIEAWGLDFHLGNSTKYIARAGKKTGESAIDDLQKAAWYLQRKIDELRAKAQPPAPEVAPATPPKPPRARRPR